MKGTPSMGAKSGGKNMIYCRRCGQRKMNINKGKCASCGFGKSRKLRGYKCNKKLKRR